MIIFWGCYSTPNYTSYDVLTNTIIRKEYTPKIEKTGNIKNKKIILFSIPEKYSFIVTENGNEVSVDCTKEIYFKYKKHQKIKYCKTSWGMRYVKGG